MVMKEIKSSSLRLKYRIERIIKNLIAPISVLLIVVLKLSGARIKFCPVMYQRIGHLAANTEVFLRRLNAGFFDKEYRYVGVSGKPCNEQLLRMIKRQLPILRSRLLSAVVKTPVFRESGYFQEMIMNSNEYYEFSLPCVIGFTEEEEKYGAEKLQEMGIGPNDWFVCFHNRDGAYLDFFQGYKDWKYHDYRDCKISHYLLAMEYITSCGGYAIRMGQAVAEKLNTANPMIIDYANKYRSDFMDIYLSAHCKFFAASSSGLHEVPVIFSRPTIMTNAAAIELPSFRKGDLFLPKKIKDIETKRLLSFRDIFSRGIGRYLLSSQYERAGLELIENEPEEILSVVMEMNEILDGKIRYTEEDEQLQNKYWSLVEPHHYCYKCPARVGKDFLNQNKLLLE